MADSSVPGQAASGTRRLVAAELLPALDAYPSYAVGPDTLPAIRAGSAAARAAAPPLPPELQAVQCREVRIPGLNGAPDVRALVYSPATAATTLRPGYLHLHGGGYVLGDPELSDAGSRSMVHELGCVVVSVDYRLAPETRWPGPIEDSYAALLWLHRQAKELGVDSAKIAIGGESAGGGHSAALAIYARDRGEVSICHQSLDSPMLDDRTGATSEPHPYCGEFVWTPSSNRFGWECLLGCPPGGDVPAGSVPARVEDLSGLPSTFIMVGAIDLFLEEDLEFARRLIRAGVPTEVHVIPGAFHGFNRAGPDTPQVRGATRLRYEALARAWR